MPKRAKSTKQVVSDEDSDQQYDDYDVDGGGDDDLAGGGEVEPHEIGDIKIKDLSQADLLSVLEDLHVS